MDRFTRQELETLLRHRNGPCVSLYLPTHRTGAQLRQDPIRHKNLLTKAEDHLRQYGLRRPEIERLLEPAWRLNRDVEGRFWTHQSDGLAMFLAPGLWRSYCVPLPFDELVVVNSRFHVTPMLPLLQVDGRFYVLAVSQRRVRLFEATRFNMRPLSPEGLPKNLAEALNIDEYVKENNFHSYRPAPNQPAEAMWHGHGGGDQGSAKMELQEYFRRLDDGLQKFFTVQTDPLVFAGVDYLFPLFREASTYRYLVETPVTGNPDDLVADQLHRAAWGVVEPYFRRQLEESLSRFGHQQARGLASGDLEEIIAAAREGRVDTLFVAQGRHRWGAVDEETGQIDFHDTRQHRSLDLPDYAAAHTILNRGQVYLIRPEQMPAGHEVAAIFRYAVPAAV